MIRHIVFDWGGVLSPGGTPDEVEVSLASALHTSRTKARLAFLAYADEFKRSLITEADFWRGLEKSFDTTIPLNKRDIWTPVKYLKPADELLQFATELKRDGYTISILSNTFPPTAESLRKTGWYDQFDYVLLSSEVGMAKPDEEFYNLLLEETGFRANESVFIDDQEKCLEPARKLGFATIKAESPAQIVADLNQVLGRS